MTLAKFLDSLRPLISRGPHGRREAIQQLDGAISWLADHPQPDYGAVEIARLKAARLAIEKPAARRS